jgi:homoserine/homoserine lactone efflux protein
LDITVHLDVWLLFVITETLLCLTPGPAVLFVVSHGLARGGRASLAANAGILTANAVYFGLSAVGLGAVLVASHQLFTALKYAGAAYLIYLGIQTIRGGGLSIHEAATVAAGESASRTWARATALQLANPKALVFFSALLPQFVDTTASVAMQFFVLGTTSALIEFVVLAAYGYLAANMSRLAREPRFRTITNRISGTMLIVAGAGVALNRSR